MLEQKVGQSDKTKYMEEVESIVQTSLGDYPHIPADAFSGALWALDGVRDGLVLLNGPTGCKFYHASISNGQYCRGTSYNPAQIDEEFYFRQNRIPCTYLDGNDFVYGAEDKLRKALQKTVKKNHHFVAVVNSPGAALIGDNLEGILEDEIGERIPWLAIENTGFSEAFYRGFQLAGCALLNKLNLKATEAKPKAVNLIGFSIYQKHYEGNIAELTRLLRLVGVEVLCTPFAACTGQQLQESAIAELNILIAPEAGSQIARWYQDKLQIPCLELPVPIGFNATQVWITSICEKLAVDAAPAIDDLNKKRAISFMHLQSFNSLSGYPKGTTFAIKADFSTARGLYHFLVPYLGMLPSAIEFHEEPKSELLDAFKSELAKKGLEASLSSVDSAEFHMLFADGNTISQQKAQGKTFTGVEVCMPSLGYTDVIPKATMGGQGALYLIEQVINGLKWFCK
jgi:nitrogenase molybdenum-iron protein alpha/beta subunit